MSVVVEAPQSTYGISIISEIPPVFPKACGLEVLDSGSETWVHIILFRS